MISNIPNSFINNSFWQNSWLKPKNKANDKLVAQSAATYNPVFYYPVSFGSKTLCKGLNLVEKDEYGRSLKIPVRVSVMAKKNHNDMKMMRELSHSWAKTELGGLISDDYFNMKVGFVSTMLLEDESNKENNKVYSAATVVYSDNKPHSVCAVEYLQSSPEVLNNPEIKGAGEIMLYAIVKDAIARKADSVILYPLDNVFSYYKHIGFHPMNYKGSYGLNSSEFDKFLKRIETKYSFNCSE